MEPITSFTGEYRFLSNFFPSPLEVDGKLYQTVEHAFQAMKADNKADHEKIRFAETPGQAKRLGRTVKLRSDWDKLRIGVMRKLIRIKFSDKVLRAELVATGDAELTEGNTWNDFFWGVCRGKGENWLGKILMEVRAEVRGSVTA